MSTSTVVSINFPFDVKLVIFRALQFELNGQIAQDGFYKRIRY